MTIYSRDNPKEHRWARLRISFLKEQVLGLDDQVRVFYRGFAVGPES
eukprot:COSAG01_NODE_805_length_13443_cov_81.464928_19_plen_47_part_00